VLRERAVALPAPARARPRPGDHWPLRDRARGAENV